MGVCVSFGVLSGCDWVVKTGVWGIEGGVCVVTVGGSWVFLECVCEKICLCLLLVGEE